MLWNCSSDPLKRNAGNHLQLQPADERPEQTHHAQELHPALVLHGVLLTQVGNRVQDGAEQHQTVTQHHVVCCRRKKDNGSLNKYYFYEREKKKTTNWSIKVEIFSHQPLQPFVMTCRSVGSAKTLSSTYLNPRSFQRECLLQPWPPPPADTPPPPRSAPACSASSGRAWRAAWAPGSQSSPAAAAQTHAVNNRKRHAFTIKAWGISWKYMKNQIIK